MVRFWIVFFILFYQQLAISQPAQDAKRDYVWITGYVSTDDSVNFPDFRQGYRLDFSTNPVNVFKFHNKLDITFNTATICDLSGHLLFYVNGCKMVDWQEKVLLGGDKINIGSLGYLISCPTDGHIIQQGSLILPRPNHSNLYSYFHQSINYINPIRGLEVDSLRISQVEQDELTGNLKATFTNHMVVDNDTLAWGHLTACRHANGRDWWILQPQQGRNGYYIILLDPNGAAINGFQEIGIPIHYLEKGWGQAVFSPDGSKYARYIGITDVQLFDFNRCTGELSNFQSISIHDTGDTLLINFTKVPGYGISFSANSRFMYVASTDTVFQFDMSALDIQNSKIPVLVYDGSYVDWGYWFTFNYMQLAPDGKIYFTAPGAIETIHVIENPDSLGLACNAIQHKYILDYPISRGWMNFPNFRLGALAGSGCDTITTTQTIEKNKKINIYPNPASDYCIVDILLNDYSNKNVNLVEIVNEMGAVVEKHQFSAYSSIYRFEIKHLPNGVYSVVLKENGQIVGFQKLLKMSP
jgi:formylmethanofuran dehydrogenase subunit D